MNSRLLILLCAATLSASAQDTEPTISELRETISEIVNVQTLESEERLGWQERKESFNNLLELHRRELNLLNEELEKAGQSAPAHDEATEQMKAEIESLKAARALASEAVARNVPRILSLSAQFPQPLKNEMEPELVSLNDWKSSDEPRDAFRSILTLLAKAEQFNRRFTRTTEIRDGREVEVLYLGLAQAFYSGKKQTAGIGKPGPDGWTWKSQPEIRPELITAFETLDKKRPPSMVTLPLEVR